MQLFDVGLTFDNASPISCSNSSNAIIVLVVGTFLVAHEIRQQRIQEILAGPVGWVTYRCSSFSKTVDYNPKTIGPVELILIAHYKDGQPTEWRVQRPGSPPIRTMNFNANTGSIGGSQGILWHNFIGKKSAATLSFSDIVHRGVPQTIWVEIF